jgi:hypothetical protein
MQYLIAFMVIALVFGSPSFAASDDIPPGVLAAAEPVEPDWNSLSKERKQQLASDGVFGTEWDFDRCFNQAFADWHTSHSKGRSVPKGFEVVTPPIERAAMTHYCFLKLSREHTDH